MVFFFFLCGLVFIGFGGPGGGAGAGLFYFNWQSGPPPGAHRLRRATSPGPGCPRKYGSEDEDRWDDSGKRLRLFTAVVRMLATLAEVSVQK